MLRPCIVWQLIKVLAEMLSQGGRYLNLKNGKEAIEVTEGKSSRMRWVTLRTFMILWFIEESFWLQYPSLPSIPVFNKPQPLNLADTPVFNRRFTER